MPCSAFVYALFLVQKCEMLFFVKKIQPFFMTIHFILSAMFFTAIVGAISGRVYTRFVPDVDYQLLPTWMFAGVLSSFIALAVSCMLALVFGNIIEDFYPLLAVSVCVSEVFLLWIMYKSITNK